ncbi:MAG: hypothetical protein HFF10_10680 [Angelakisella sp.]|jgi:hypothetical protein|nr:hypothetical protein [Angelakisella sp.]
MELNFDIKAKAEEIVEKLKKDPALLKRFQDAPIKTLETLTGIDLPDEQLKPVVAAVKAKLATADLGDVLGAVKGLF